MDKNAELRSWAETVKADFLSELNKIDLSKPYNPDSAEFDRALRLGLMWRLMLKIDVGDISTETDDIKERLMSADRHRRRYAETKDRSCLDMAMEDLRQAESLIKRANARLPGAEERQRLREYEAVMRELQSGMDG